MPSTIDRTEHAQRLTARLDTLSIRRLHLLILAGCCIGFSFDLAEVAFGNILSAVFSAPPYSVSGLDLSWLLAVVYIGAAFGAPLLGWLSDRFGRRTVLFWAMILLSLASVFAAAAPGINELILSRAIAGISLGAYPPLMFAYLTDVLPPARRGSLIVTATAIGYVGPPAFIFLVRWLTPLHPLGFEAWRWGFLIAAIGASACAVGFWKLPESARWLIQKSRLVEAEATISAFERSATVGKFVPDVVAPSTSPTTVSVPVARRSLPREAFFFMALYFLTPWATVGFTLLSGAVLIQKGINVQDSLLYVGISTFGPIFGTLSGGALVERAERRTFLVMNALAMGVTGVAFGAFQTPVALVALALLFNILVALFLPVLVLYAAETVSTDNRAKLTSWAWTANRVGSALVPLILLPVLHLYGAITMFVVVAATLAMFIIVLLIFGSQGSAGKTVG